MKYLSNHKVNVRTIRKLADGEGMTLRNGRPVEYKKGYQVATHGVECYTPEEASKLIHSSEFRKAAGIWFEKGVYYIDFSIRVPTLARAIEIGTACNQISIYSWGRTKHDKLIYLR